MITAKGRYILLGMTNTLSSDPNPIALILEQDSAMASPTLQLRIESQATTEPVLSKSYDAYTGCV